MSSQAPLRPASATQWPAMPQPPCHVARPLVSCWLEMSQLECCCSLIPVDISRLCSLLGFTPTIRLLHQRGLRAEAGPLAACPRATGFPWLPGSRPGPEPDNAFPPQQVPAGGSYLPPALLPTAQAWHTPLWGRLCPHRSLLSAASRVRQHLGASAVP